MFKKISKLQRGFFCMLIPPDIQKAEIFNNEGNNIFEKLSEKYYNDKYGTTSAERILTCAG